MFVSYGRLSKTSEWDSNNIYAIQVNDRISIVSHTRASISHMHVITRIWKYVGALCATVRNFIQVIEFFNGDKTVNFTFFNGINSKLSAGLTTWGLIQYRIRHLIGKSRKDPKARDRILKYSHRFEIWQAPRQRCRWGACQTSEQLENSNRRSCAFET